MVLYGPIFRREVRSWLPIFGPLLGPATVVRQGLHAGHAEGAIRDAGRAEEQFETPEAQNEQFKTLDAQNELFETQQGQGQGRCWLGNGCGGLASQHETLEKI